MSPKRAMEISKQMIDDEIRQMRSPLTGWMGGKSQLSRRIVPQIPEHLCYVEPFAGAAWVFFRKAESQVEVLNDINHELVTFYRCVQHHLEEFIRYFKWVLISRDEFERLKRVDPSTLTDIQRAARFYYIQQQCFGGRLISPTFGYAAVRAPKFNLLRIEETLSETHVRLARVYIECLPYSEIIKRYDKPTTFFYCDPPYEGCEAYYGKGVFEQDDFEKLANQLAGIQGKFLLSLNDSPLVRRLFASFSIEPVSVVYSCSNGSNKKVGEVLIKNF